MPKNTNRLRVIRVDRKKKISQRDTAERARMSVDRYWRIENGYDAPDPTEKKNIARALGVTVDEAFPPVDQAVAP